MVTIKTSGVIALMLAFMVSLGVNINNVINDEGIVIDEGYLPYSCDLEHVNDMYCYKLSRVGTTGVNRNCYYDRDRGAKYKICSTGWERIEPYQECPVCYDCPTCEECPAVIECNVCEECTQEECIKVYGGGWNCDCPSCDNNCPPCSKDCPKQVDCDKVNVVAYTDIGKFFCDGIGSDATCYRDGDLSMPFDMLVS